MTTRSFIRSTAGSQANVAEVAASLREALDADGGFDVLDEVGGASVPAFMVALHPRGPGLIATTPNGRLLGVYACPMAAVRFSFAALDREAAERVVPRLRSRRSTRGTAAGGAIG